MVQLTNASGAVTQSYDYDAFGNQFSPYLTDSNMFRYSGEYLDEETDFYYLRARQYSPAIGRFTQEDTYRGEYASPLSLNLYTYCYNDPVQYWDPTGNHAWDVFIDIACLSSSGAAFLVNPSMETLLMAAVDAAALVIPNVPSPVLRTAVNSVQKTIATKTVDEVIEHSGGVLNAVAEIGNSIIKAVDNLVDDIGEAVVTKAAKTGSARPLYRIGELNELYNGFKNFDALKKFLGSPGTNNEWHHIVERSQVGKRAKFLSRDVNNVNNIIAIPKDIHVEISAHYSSKLPQTNNKTVRDWLADKSFEFQFEYGVNELKKYGDVVFTNNGWEFIQYS